MMPPGLRASLAEGFVSPAMMFGQAFWFGLPRVRRMLSPVISQMDWSGVPWIVRNYIIPDYNGFGIFPWGAYLAFGVSAGSVIRAIPRDATGRCMQWAALLGGALILVCQYMANSPFTIYAKSEFWLNSPAQVLTKVGVLFLMVSFAFLWTR